MKYVYPSSWDLLKKSGNMSKGGLLTRPDPAVLGLGVLLGAIIGAGGIWLLQKRQAPRAYLPIN
jgi:hypothetical protein